MRGFNEEILKILLTISFCNPRVFSSKTCTQGQYLSLQTHVRYFILSQNFILFDFPTEMFKTFEHFNFIKMGRKYLDDEAGLGGWAAPRSPAKGQGGSHGCVERTLDSLL